MGHACPAKRAEIFNKYYRKTELGHSLNLFSCVTRSTHQCETPFYSF